MTPVQLPLPAQFHTNKQLFSDYYLNTVLPQRPDWQAHVAALLPLREQVREILAGAPSVMNEAQTEDRVVKPILALLGHTYEVQAGLRTPFGLKRPDYVFYPDDARRLAMAGRELNAELLRNQCLAIGDAKLWGRALDVALKEAAEATGQISDNPVVQIAFYMRHSGATWGLLTNGKLWRLYHKDTVELLDRHYEVDLPAILAGPPEAFAFFVGFFHRSAFDDQATGIAAILRDSQQQARGISERLKEQVYEALRHLAQGFLDHTPNALTTDPATLKVVYDNCLIVLYRLLFVFYAEARELLPLRENETYRRTYSLASVVATARQRETRLPGTARLWQQLSDLFVIINEGSPPLQVSTFNGGLFDPQRHPFLERKKIGDARLQEAIMRLAVVDGQLVDYRDLGERHLGTIYEGLLEYHLQPVVGEAGWTIDLFNDRGERHRTGSYYTPDFVVQYIVEQTLRPVLDEAVAGKTTDAEKIAAILGVNCIDPSMGSGHFPVAAMEFIARYLVAAGVEAPEEAHSEADLTYWRRRVAQSCIYGVDLNPLAVDLAKLSLWIATTAKGQPLSFLDHHLRTGNALIGARASDLDSNTSKKTKRNKQAAAASETGQLSLLDDAAFAGAMSSAVGSMWLIEGSAGRTVDEVKEQEKLYEQVRAALTERFALLADLAAAADFGQAPERSLWKSLAEYGQKRDTGAFATPAFERPLEQVRQLKAAQRFFHWDLEFPEVFYDRHGRPLGDQAGFDAVLGNPPYVRQEQLGPLKPYFQNAFPETYSGTADLFVYFFHQGVKLLREGGRLGYIASNSWLRANYATPLRAFLREQVTVEQLIDLGDNRVFADAPDVYPAIPIVRKAAPPEDHTAQAATFSRGEGLKEFERQVTAKLTPVSIHDQQDSGWQLGADVGRSLALKLLQTGKSLAEYTENRMFRGVLTGANEVFIIDQARRDTLIAADPSSAALIKPILRGEDLRPWYQEQEGRYVIFTRRGVAIENYPAIKASLEQHRAALEPRPADWQGNNWPGRKPGSYQWYEIQDSVDYYQAFDQPKILWPDIAKFPRFSWDEDGTYVNDKGAIVVPSSPYVLGILQSRVNWYCISQLCVPLGERAGSNRYQQKLQFISRLPIPDAPEPERQVIGDLAMQITEEAKARYALHRRARNRILSDLGTSGKGLNQKLTAWWQLDFPAFREEIRKVFKREIALKERDDWEEWLQEQRRRHERHTAAIVAGETELNAHVYRLFDLNAEEIALIEASTKYQYGET
jgi:hypothetical protein